MKNGARTALAAICWAIVSKRDASHVHSFSDNSSRMVNVTVQNREIQCFDFEESCHISGQVNGTLFHFGGSYHIQIDQDGTEFTGFDFGTSTHYEAKVTGNAVQIFDFETTQFYQYQVQ